MKVSQVNNQSFGIMMPLIPAYNKVPDAVPAIVQSVQAVKPVRAFLKANWFNNGLPINDCFRRHEAIVSDPRIRILYPSGTVFLPFSKDTKILPRNLKGPGKQYSGKTIWVH